MFLTFGLFDRGPHSGPPIMTLISPKSSSLFLFPLLDSLPLFPFVQQATRCHIVHTDFLLLETELVQNGFLCKTPRSMLQCFFSMSGETDSVASLISKAKTASAPSTNWEQPRAQPLSCAPSTEASLCRSVMPLLHVTFMTRCMNVREGTCPWCVVKGTKGNYCCDSALPFWHLSHLPHLERPPFWRNPCCITLLCQLERV